MKPIKLVLFFVSVFILTGCASSYKKINPDNLRYNSSDVVEDVKLSYKYDLLHKKYAKKEVKNRVKLVAVELTNNSDKDYVIGKDLNFTFSNGTKAMVLSTDEAYRAIKQNVAVYLLYLPLTFTQLTVSKTNSDGYTETSATPIGLVLGPGITLGNMLGASGANNNLKADLEAYDLYGKTLKKGETMTGLITISSTSHDALSIVLE